MASKRRYYSEAEMEFIREQYAANVAPKVIAAHLNRTSHSIHMKAYAMGLTNSKPRNVRFRKSVTRAFVEPTDAPQQPAASQRDTTELLVDRIIAAIDRNTEAVERLHDALQINETRRAVNTPVNGREPLSRWLFG